MRLKFCVVLLTLTALAWAVENTQAGVVRYAAKKMQKPEHVAASAVGTAGAGVKTAGQTTSGALGRGWSKNRAQKEGPVLRRHPRYRPPKRSAFYALAPRLRVQVRNDSQSFQSQIGMDRVDLAQSRGD